MKIKEENMKDKKALHEDKISVWDYLCNIGMILYLVVLFLERVAASLLPFIKEEYSYVRSGDALSWYVHILTLCSLVAAVVVLRKQFPAMIVCLFTSKREKYEKLDYKIISYGSGVLLLGGMVHTNFTLAPVQFIAYGGMILAMLAVTLRSMKEKRRPAPLLWISFLAAVCFAMAIPVVYATQIEAKVFFTLTECVVSFAFVVVFTFMLSGYFSSGGVIKFPVWLFIATLLLDLLLFFLRMEEEVNIFLIAFPCLYAIFWIAGRIKYGKNPLKTGECT